ncbi:MAG: L-glutamate gamma-semialdehyde dehydrogenase [Burkholderiales bacterium]|nr:L-glutamate gamma-semialdehyde dehydrogenase [Burkholderiales bacterium]
MSSVNPTRTEPAPANLAAIGAASDLASALCVDRLPAPVRAEAELAAGLLAHLRPRLDWAAVHARALPWVEQVRAHPAPFWALESLLREFPISSAEGRALMRLAEALLRVPDTETAIALASDQLATADFAAHASTADGAAGQLVGRLAGQALALAQKLLPQDGEARGLIARLGAHGVVAATLRAIGLLGEQFVLGQDIDAALKRADAARAEQARQQTAGLGEADAALPLRHSYDMLGEGARTEADALRYLDAYHRAITAIARSQGRAERPEDADGISIKLSALFERYEAAQADEVARVLLPRVVSLANAAAAANIHLTIDAEECERLELSIALIDAMCAQLAASAPGWRGLGLALQAYQQRAPELITELAALARRHGRRLMVRLVKGAYWDAEIKRAQELGLAGYPVWTHKHHTDLAYLACAEELLAAPDCFYPQFATHNAATLAALMELADRAPALPPGAHPDRFELQRLHGMGEAVHRELQKSTGAPALRVYAPVGPHRDLLAYLVRRLLENGANSSFVHQLADSSVSPEELLASPLYVAAASGVVLPPELYGTQRRNSAGLDLACAAQRLPLQAAIAALPQAPRLAPMELSRVDAVMRALHAAQPAWNATPLAERCAVLSRAADALEARTPEFIALLVREGRKTMGDAVAELREAVDFCRYYAAQAATDLAPRPLPGPTGERNELRLHGRGVFVCISPWNFPLAIFAGQVVAALVAGNSVAAKPAEQTPAVAAAFVDLLVLAGLPRGVLTLCHGSGPALGAALVAHPAVAGVCFTGSTGVAKTIQRRLAEGDGAIVPLIAETGGLNAMIMDSSALPEQVVDAVVQSAFRSAGQRCSALRVLCIHEAVADKVIEMLAGAMASLRSGAPDDWATDVGPIIDSVAHGRLTRHVERLTASARLLACGPLAPELAATHIAPVAFELNDLAELKEEIFGPVLHVVRWGGSVDELVGRINALGYGLTLGIHTRIDSRALRIAAQAHVGNVYVNRNMIGAVVGVQPFGGEGRSGTGPKAGGPLYLYRFCAEQTLTINTTAAGGNVDLMSQTIA